jgi:glycosyltransferase involved in cell wall biosynthesis
LPKFGYYIQDFEPYFYREGTIERQLALKSYTKIPGIKRFCKTKWTRLEIQGQTEVSCELIGLSLNVDLFRPRPRRDPSWPQRPLRIAAMIRPATPRRAARLTMEVLETTYAKHGNNIEIILFGVDDDDPDFLNLPRSFVWENIGKLPSEELALLFNESDIFVDFSSFQAMGLSAMEAMACGVAVIVPLRGGATDFARHEKNALIIDTGQKDNCISALDRLINDAYLRERLSRQAIFDMAQYYPEIPASNILEILFRADTQ